MLNYCLFRSPKNLTSRQNRHFSYAIKESVAAAEEACTFSLVSSILERNFLLFLAVQPAENSGPSEVSAVNECLVPLLDSNMKPGRSSLRIVHCYKQVQIIRHKTLNSTEDRAMVFTQNQIGI